MVEAKLLRKKLKNGLIVDKWDLVTIIEKQQAEIEALRKSHIELERGIVKDLNQRQSAEPVAWMVDGVLFTSLGAALNISFDIEQPCIPLYTHPVKEFFEDEPQAEELHEIMQSNTHPVEEQDTDCQYCKQGCIRCDARKQLTDEEILAVWDNDCVVLDEDKLVIRFARAILRKAQE